MERLTTSQGAKEILERLNRATGIRANFWARAGLGLSLSLDELPEESDEIDSDGREFPRAVLFGEDEAALMALLRERHGKPLEDGELGRAVKLHIERGLRLIEREYEKQNKRGDELLLQLLRKCTSAQQAIVQQRVSPLPPVPKTGAFGIELDLGEEAATKDRVTHILNGPGIAPHLAVMGRNGSGKTRTALSLLSKIAATAPYPVPCLVFDYAKGDIADNKAFVDAIGATVIPLPGMRIPLAPLALPNADDHTVTLAAHRFRDTICSVVRGLGAKQKSRCLDILRMAYAEAGPDTIGLDDIVSVAEREYSTNGWAEDSLLACLKEFTDFTLFRPANQGIDHEFFLKSHVIDIHGLPEDLRKLTVFLMLDRLYSEIMALPDAPLDSAGNRQLRLLVVIDEGHHYLACRQETLQKMVREVRSKGVGVWLLSQSPDDFDQPNYNFAREMGLAIVFACVLEKPKMLEALLGGKLNPQRLSQLSPGVAVTRVGGGDRPIEFRAWTP